MSIIDTDLAEVRAAVGNAHPATTSEVARFKEEGAAKTDRVVAVSQNYIVYSLRNRASLRVIIKHTTPATQLAYKKHTDDVTAAKFVNVRSNIVASTSANELLVWYVDNDNSIYTYFSCAVNIATFSWVPVQGSPPDLLVVFGAVGASEKAGKKAALVASSKLIIKTTTMADGAIGKPSGDDVADEAQHFTTVHGNVTATKATSAALAPLIAVSAGADTIVTGSLVNTSTPAWKPTEGAAVEDFVLLPQDILAVASASAIFLWEVASEPRLLQRIALGGSKCLGLKATSTRLVAFLSTGNPKACEAVCIKVNKTASAAAFYKIDAVITRSGCCLNALREEDPEMLVDTGAMLQIQTLQGAAWTTLNHDGPAAVVNAPKEGKRVVPAPSRPAVQVMPQSAMPQQQLPGYNMPQQQQQNNFMQQPQQQMRVNVGANPNVLRNQALAPAAGIDASGLDMTADMAHAKTNIDNAVRNTGSMLGLVKTMIPQDHEQLVQEALKAQAAETVRLVMANAGGKKAAVSNNGEVNAFDSVLEGIMPQVAAALVDGISTSIEEQVRGQLDESLRAAMTKHQKKQGKGDMHDQKAKVDNLINDVMAGVHTSVREKHAAYGNRLIHYITDLSNLGSKAVQEMSKVVQQQQDTINAFTNSGLLEEVQRLRKQVAALQDGSAQQDAADALSSELPQATVLENARGYLANGDHLTGLQWILRYDDADLLHQLLSEIDDETTDAMLEDEAVPAHVWGKMVASLASTPKPETLEVSVAWLRDILLEKATLTANVQLMTTVSSFIGAWKQSPNLSAKVVDSLRTIIITIRK